MRDISDHFSARIQPLLWFSALWFLGWEIYRREPFEFPRRLRGEPPVETRDISTAEGPVTLSLSMRAQRFRNEVF
jgi:hypothetical protein